ncbi:unnamed protein product [Prunus brigantina]
MRILGRLESLSNLEDEVVFFTDVFKHGLRLPLRHSVQKILAQIGYAPRQEMGAVELPVGRPAWAFCGWGAELTEDVVTASGKAWESALGMPFVSLKWPTMSKKDVEAIKRVRRAKIAQEDRFFKTLLDFGNLHKAGLITEAEHARRKKEKEEEYVGALISTGTTASVPKAREKGVSPVDLWYYVLMAHSSSGSIYGHSPLASPSFFFSVFLIKVVEAIKLFTVVRDDCIWEAESANDVFPYEVLDFSSGDCSKGFGFDPLCEVVHNDDCKFELSLALRHRANEIQSPLCERPRTDHRGERFGWQLWNRAKSLALVALLYKLDDIRVESWPIIALSNGFEGQGSSSRMVVASTFMNLS